MWIATNSNGEKVIFNYKPSRYKKPIKVESKEWEEDYHGHFYHPMIDSGEYIDVWARHTNYYFDLYDYGDSIKHIENFSDIIKNQSWEDEPIEL